jgi:hypothetical protein
MFDVGCSLRAVHHPAMKPFLLVLSLLALPLFAQTPTPAPPSADPTKTAALPLFRAKLPGGMYEVAVRSIVAVTSHEYIVDGIARVTEVNVDTSGSLLARFYYIEPQQPNSPLGLGTSTLEKAQELFKEAADKTGQDAWKKVIKNYPTTTHARTVEYRMQKREDLDKIFEAAEEAFRLQKNKSITIGA